ncbi:MAG: hypothetical protein ACRCSK_06930 [Fusobacteriaceae bacterium]
MEKNSMFYMLSKRNLFFIIGFYIVLFFIASAVLIKIIFLEYSRDKEILDIFLLALIGGGASALLGSTMGYIRKIYLLCILKKLKKDMDEFEKIGNLIYFYIRPFFAIMATIIIIIGIHSGVFVFVVSDNYKTNLKFLDFSIVIGFLFGYSSGVLLDQIKKIGEKIIENGGLN